MASIPGQNVNTLEPDQGHRDTRTKSSLKGDMDPLSSRIKLNLNLANGQSDRQLHPVDHHPLETQSANYHPDPGTNPPGTNHAGPSQECSHDDDGNLSRGRSKPSSPVHETILSGDVLSNWIHCICVVTFDIELGQAIEKIYPPNVHLSEKERSNICYLSFPDSNSGCMGDTQFHFRTRSCPATVPTSPGNGQVQSNGRKSDLKSPIRQMSGHPLRKKSRAFVNALKEYNETCLSSLEVDQSHYYGYVYFRQTKDPSVKRGYFQKSLVLISRLPFVTLYKTVVSMVANEFFDSGSFDVIEYACSEIDTKWPLCPSVGPPGMELSLLNKVIHVKIPRKSEGSHGSVGKITGTLTSPTTPAKGIHASSSSPSFRTLMTLAENEDNLDNQKPNGIKSRPMSPPSIMFLSSPNEINYFQCFFPLLQEIQFLWELVITCEPIIVMAPTPDVTCEVVQALVNCIYPLKYVPDFRPFFTIHDSEFKEYTATGVAPPPAILGVTNPFFAKTLQHWPNIVRIGEYTSMSPKRRMSPKVGNLIKTSSSSFDSSPGIHSRTKPFLIKDKTIMKRITERVDEHRPSEVHSAFLKKFFLQLTSAFLIPLERYMVSLIPSSSVTAFKSLPSITPFNQDDFFRSLCGQDKAPSRSALVGLDPFNSPVKGNGHPAELSGIKGDWVGLYKKFFRSPNFSSWFENKFNELETSLKQLHIKSIFEADLLDWIKDKSEVEIIDLVLILKKKIRDMETDHGIKSSEIKSSEIMRSESVVKEGDKLLESEAIKKANHEHIIKLNKLLTDIISVLPEDLHLILNKSDN